jgi:hypothetical protein
LIYRLLADALVAIHLGFVLFVVLGGLLAVRWPRAAFVHLPAAAWGAYISLTAGVCPLTPLENRLRRMGGEAGYDGSFIEHYVVPVLYPRDLTPAHQVVLGAVVIVVNVAVYAWAIARWRRSRSA